MTILVLTTSSALAHHRRGCWCVPCTPLTQDDNARGDHAKARNKDVNGWERGCHPGSLETSCSRTKLKAVPCRLAEEEEEERQLEQKESPIGHEKHSPNASHFFTHSWLRGLVMRSTFRMLLASHAARINPPGSTILPCKLWSTFSEEAKECPGSLLS